MLTLETFYNKAWGKTWPQHEDVISKAEIGLKPESDADDDDGRRHKRALLRPPADAFVVHRDREERRTARETETVARHA